MQKESQGNKIRIFGLGIVRKAWPSAACRTDPVSATSTRKAPRMDCLECGWERRFQMPQKHVNSFGKSLRDFVGTALSVQARR